MPISARARRCCATCCNRECSGIGAYLVVADKASGGIMIASSIMMGRALAPVEVALGTWKQLVAARQGIARLREICKATAKPPAPPVALPRPCRELSVQELAVAAPGTDKPIVSNVSFSLKAGMGLALLGASASGKTSLSKALVGIWPAAARRGAARRRRARSMGQRGSRPLYRLSAAGRGVVRRHRRRKHLPLR